MNRTPEVQRERFNRIVQQALDELPENLASFLDNVAIVVEREPSPHDLAEAGLEPGSELFGLYVGTPLVDRFNYQMVLPDRILIYQGPHERRFQHEQLAEEIRRTVIHEVAHHFGIDDDRLHELGWG
jgi:predicted Zn-dependent protease with MMP-like domain